MNIGEKIRKLRVDKGLSQENMADELEMTQAGYSKIESNGGSITYDKLAKIAEVLGTTVENIVGGEEKATFNNMFQKVKAQKQISTTLPITSEMKELYEDRARLQEDKIKLLEEKIQFLEEKTRTLIEKK